MLKSQLKARNRERPLLGCFALTERLAGVNSGLVVDTTAEFHDGHFIINTPTPSAAKNWISQVKGRPRFFCACCE